MSATTNVKPDMEKKLTRLTSCLDILCIVCERKVGENQYSLCVYNHVTCWSCEPINEGLTFLLSSNCRGCQKKLLDPSNLIPRHPPRLDKTFLLQKLVKQSEAICEVTRHHNSSKLIPADVYCSDCHTYICSQCISDHIEMEDHIPHHTIVNLKRKQYEPSEPWCLDCKEKPAISFCKHHACAKAVCPNCLRYHSDHDVIPLNLSSDMMTEYVRQHCEDVDDQYREVVMEKESLIDEQRTRKAEILSVSNLVHDWARKLRQKVDNDEKELVNIIDNYCTAMDDKYTTLFDVLYGEEINLSYFRHIHNIFKDCDAAEKFVDAFTFLRLNEGKLVDETDSYAMHSADTAFRCEKIDFKIDQRAINALQNANGHRNLLGSISQLSAMSLTDSGTVKHKDDSNGPKLTAMTLTLDGKLVILDSGNRRIKVVNTDHLDEVLLSVDISKTLHSDKLQLSPSQVLFDERKNNFIINIVARSTILEVREDGSVYRGLQNVKNCTSICLSRDFLYVARRAEGTDCFRGVLDRFDRITWTRHSANELNLVPDIIALAPGNMILTSDTKAACIYALDTIEFAPIFKIEGKFEDLRMKAPSGLTSTIRGHVVVCDTFNNRILEFSNTGKFLRVLLTDKDGIRRPERVVCDEHEILYVIDGAGIVKVFSYVHGLPLRQSEADSQESTVFE